MNYFHAKRDFIGRLSALTAALLCLAPLAPAARAQAQAQPEDVVRVRSELVQTDVMVFDKSGKFVDGLTREQFELKVDGRPVPVSFFERVTGGMPKGGAGAASTAAAPGAAGAARAQGRTVIFFIDDLHLSLDNLQPTRAAVTRFIDDEMAPGDLVALVTASGQLGFLQQFTDNKALLRAALARLKNIPDGARDSEQPPMSEYIATRIANGDRQAAAFYVNKTIEGLFSKAAAGAGPNPAINSNAVFEMVKTRATNITKAMESVTSHSLRALDQLVRTAGQIEGRKLVFFISDGFYLDGKGTTGSVVNERLQLAIDRAARTGTVVYSIDARGLFAPFSDAAGRSARDPNGFLDRSSVGEAALAQEGLAALADATGGEFLKNQNYFDRWVSRVIEETSNFYRMAWRPEADAQKDERFRRVEVAVVGRPDLTVRLHRGYVPAAVRAAEDAKADASKSAAKGPEAELRAALSAPAGVRGLTTALSTSFVDVPGSGAVLTSSVEIGTDGLDYGADGKQPAAVDLVGVVLNDLGKQVSNFKTRLNVEPSAPAAAPAAAAAERPGVIYSYRSPLAPGLYQVRAAARDARGGRLGSAAQWIEIPDLSKKQLTLSSLHLGGRQVGGGKDSKEAPQIQFSVTRRFPRSTRLDFLGFVYNAARQGGTGDVNLSVAVRVLRDNKAIVAAPARKLAPEAGSDLARIPIVGGVSLGQLPAGRYELEVAVSDSLAGTNASQRVWFDIE